ncbi:hypothetical protein [Ruegeria arenilitoris]|nr:hypothetical protein [Ruegeria arenilitoris]
MLSILARTFMVATQTDPRDELPKPKWLSDDHWWKKSLRVTGSCSK